MHILLELLESIVLVFLRQMQPLRNRMSAYLEHSMGVSVPMYRQTQTMKTGSVKIIRGTVYMSISTLIVMV